MSYRRTPEQVAAVQATLADVEFVGGESLSVDFLTRPGTVRDVLPAELDPGAEPRVTVQVSRWRSNCVGDFAASAVYVSASHRGTPGDYVLTMFMDSDVPMLFGRDLFGEPKKLGASTLWRNDDHMTGRLERHGTRLIEIEADLGPDRGPSEVLGRNYNVKYELSADGTGLTAPPTLTMAEFAQRTTVVRSGPASLRLQGTEHDPLDTLDVVELRKAVYVETGMKATCVPVAALDADAFLPLALGRSDYWPSLATARLPV